MFLKLYVFYFNTKIITMNFNELVSISSKTYFGRMSSRLWRYKLISSILFNLHIVFFLNSHGWKPVTFWRISWLHPSPVYHYKYFEFQIQAETETARTIYFSPRNRNQFAAYDQDNMKLTLHQMPKMSSWEMMYLSKIVPTSHHRNQSCLQQWILQWQKCSCNRRLVSSVGRAPVCCAGGRWFEPQTGPTLRVLK